LRDELFEPVQRRECKENNVDNSPDSLHLASRELLDEERPANTATGHLCGVLIAYLTRNIERIFSARRYAGDRLFKDLGESLSS